MFKGLPGNVYPEAGFRIAQRPHLLQKMFEKIVDLVVLFQKMPLGEVVFNHSQSLVRDVVSFVFDNQQFHFSSGGRTHSPFC